MQSPDTRSTRRGNVGNSRIIGNKKKSDEGINKTYVVCKERKPAEMSWNTSGDGVQKDLRRYSHISVDNPVFRSPYSNPLTAIVNPDGSLRGDHETRTENITLNPPSMMRVIAREAEPESRGE